MSVTVKVPFPNRGLASIMSEPVHEDTAALTFVVSVLFHFFFTGEFAVIGHIAYRLHILLYSQCLRIISHCDVLA